MIIKEAIKVKILDQYTHADLQSLSMAYRVGEIFQGINYLLFVDTYFVNINLPELELTKNLKLINDYFKNLNKKYKIVDIKIESVPSLVKVNYETFNLDNFHKAIK